MKPGLSRKAANLILDSLNVQKKWPELEQYARGFRAPPYDNANFGFRNTSFFYEILPNGILIATNIFAREDGAWRMVHHHASPAPALGADAGDEAEPPRVQ